MKALLVTFFLLSSTLFAGDKTAPKSSSDDNGGIVINDSLQKLMDVPGVKPIYESCKGSLAKESTQKTEKILTCLWEGVKDNADLKKKVQAAYTEEANAKPKTADGAQANMGRAPAAEASKPKDIVTRKTSVSTDYEKDPAVIALSKYYEKKLDEVLDPSKALSAEELKSNVTLSIDHSKFNDLYKSALGKTIINAFTSYCLDTKPSTCECYTDPKMDCAKECKIDPSTMEQDRKDNLDSLKLADLNGDSKDARKWRTCIASVPVTCGKSTAGASEKYLLDDASDKEKQSESQKRACLIMDYVSSARKNILLSDEQKKFWDDLAKEKATNIVQNTKAIDATKSSSDALLEMSSTDVKTEMDKTMSPAKAEMEACYKDNKIVDINACKKYLSTNKDANVAAIAEFGMRQIAQEGILKDELDSSPSKVKDYLKEEGFSNEDIEKMTKDEATIALTKDEILDRYKDKKAAIIAEMAKKIEDKTSTNDGKIDKDQDLSKIAKISKDLSSRTDDFSNLVKFNNIVSSYLEVTTEGSKTTSRNTASLFGEVKDATATDAKILNEQIKNANLTEPKKGKEGSSATNLDVDTINKNFLNYGTNKDPAKKD